MPPNRRLCGGKTSGGLASPAPFANLLSSSEITRHDSDVLREKTTYDKDSDAAAFRCNVSMVWKELIHIKCRNHGFLAQLVGVPFLFFFFFFLFMFYPAQPTDFNIEGRQFFNIEGRECFNIEYWWRFNKKLLPCTRRMGNAATIPSWAAGTHPSCNDSTLCT